MIRTTLALLAVLSLTFGSSVRPAQAALEGAAAPTDSGIALASSASGAQLKIAIIVGATEGTTANYRNRADQDYAEAIKYTSNVVKVYSPNATWEAVKAAIDGASIVIYRGHGNGWPSPYAWDPNYTTRNGFGLNSSAAGTDHNNKYYGEPSIRQLNLAPGAIILLHNLCYAGGSSEPGHAEPTVSVAQQRVDNYSAGFLAAGASAVIADAYSGAVPYLRALFTTNQTIESMWLASPSARGNAYSFPSARTPGATIAMDPETPTSGFYRGASGNLGFLTSQVIAGAGDLPDAEASTYFPVEPTRLLDSRTGNGLAGQFISRTPRTFQIAGRGAIPSDAVAVTGNLTVTGQTTAGYVSLGPIPESAPSTSTLNFPGGDTRANNVTVRLGVTGGLSAVFVGSSGARTHLIFDVTGYYRETMDGSRYTALDPARLLDTRTGNGLAASLTAFQPVSFAVAGRGGVPADAAAVAGNLTVTGQTGAGYVTLGPVQQANPTTSTVNVPVGDTRANGVVVTIGGDGTLSAVFGSSAGATTHLIFDVTGYFRTGEDGAVFVPLSPQRLLDSRTGNGLAGGFGTAHPRDVQVAGRNGVPVDATAVTGNLTVTGQTSGGYLSIGPLMTGAPSTSTLNFPVGDTRANGTTTRLDGGGTAGIVFMGGPGAGTHVVLDVTGYFR